MHHTTHVAMSKPVQLIAAGQECHRQADPNPLDKFVGRGCLNRMFLIWSVLEAFCTSQLNVCTWNQLHESGNIAVGPALHGLSRLLLSPLSHAC